MFRSIFRPLSVARSGWGRCVHSSAPPVRQSRLRRTVGWVGVAGCSAIAGVAAYQLGDLYLGYPEAAQRALAIAKQDHRLVTALGGAVRVPSIPDSFPAVRGSVGVDRASLAFTVEGNDDQRAEIKLRAVYLALPDGADTPYPAANGEGVVRLSPWATVMKKIENFFFIDSVDEGGAPRQWMLLIAEAELADGTTLNLLSPAEDERRPQGDLGCGACQTAKGSGQDV